MKDTKVFWVLLVSAAALFAAGASALSLPSLDDCFYARKGVEMARSGRFFTVTWAEQPTFQNPPLQFVILAATFKALGENDVAARVPSLLMGLGILLMTYRIGRQTVGQAASVTGVALLLVTPLFVTAARGCMLEIPLAFWISGTVLVYLEGRTHPRRYLLAALPLAAGILTKSVLGLLPILLFVSLMASAELRGSLRTAWLWSGIGLGVVLGASWSVHQGLVHGREALQAHYLGEILSRSAAGVGGISQLLAYPVILAQSFQPVILPALAGLWRLSRRRRDDSPATTWLLVAWVCLPLVLYSVSGATSARYIFPILPPLALCAGFWLSQTLPQVAAWLSRRAVPVLCLTIALVFVVRPSLLTRDLNASFKRHAAVFRTMVPPGDPLAYYGDHYWEHANPLLYYGERVLERPAASPDEALEKAGSRDRFLLCDRDRLADVTALTTSHEIIVEGPRWLLIRVEP